MNLVAFSVMDAAGLPPAVDGVPVVPMRAFREAMGNVPLVLFEFESRSAKFSEYFERLGCTTLFAINTDYAYREFLFVMEHLRDYYEAYEYLPTEGSSRRDYLEGLYGWISYRRAAENTYADEMQYFLAGFLPKSGDVVIDGGAYDGATAAEFTSLGCMVYAFEMDAKNFMKAVPLSERYGFTLEPFGLASCRQDMKYIPMGVSSLVMETGGETARFIDLDSYVREKGLTRVDFIKLDVEGSELSALTGAMNTISKWKPRLAVCVYHKLSDPFELPRYIKSIRPDYEFAFRHYKADLRTSPDTFSEMTPMLRELGLDNFERGRSEMVLYCR